MEERAKNDRPRAHYCRPCGKLLPIDSFHVSAIRSKKHLCKVCSVARNRAYRARRPEVVLAGNIRGYARRAGGCPRDRGLTAENVSEVFEAYDFTCAVTGLVFGPEELSIVRVDRRLPFSPSNAVPIAKRLSKTLRGSLPAWAPAWAAGSAALAGAPMSAEEGSASGEEAPAPAPPGAGGSGGGGLPPPELCHKS